MSKRIEVIYNHPSDNAASAKIRHQNGDTNIFCIEKYSTGDNEGGVIAIGLEEAEEIAHALLELTSQIKNA